MKKFFIMFEDLHVAIAFAESGELPFVHGYLESISLQTSRVFANCLVTEQSN